MKTQLLDAQQIELKLNRLAVEIYENNMQEEELLFVGIEGRGVDMAKLLKKKIEKISDLSIKMYTLAIDKESPVDSHITEAMNCDGKSIILIDDVANSGKTLMFALKNFLMVIPKKIQIAVMVDRKHKRYPVTADYIGMQISTTLQEHIVVCVEKGQLKQVYIE
ncbi:MAG TPA: phosphoribosyltransferase family protein [Chitinophagaceae bacterium]|nr:phosphoribosyltransferase family protein [Chitinophagaceae bacterium]